jgi:hypothetical protein
MKYTMLRCACLAALACALSSQAVAGELKLSMQDGRVTIMADNVPLRQILQEWARVGQAKIINADKLSGPAMTLQLVNVPEKDALDILLRSASGYIAAPRPVALASAAMYDRVTILATSRPPAATAGNVIPPTFQRPPQMPVDVDDEPINVAMPQPTGIPVNGQFPGMPPQGVQPGAPGAPNVPQTQGQPGPMTAPRPGALPMPQLPPGVPNPYQPPGTVRVPAGGRGGGGGGA